MNIREWYLNGDLKDQEGSSHANIWRKNILDRGNNICEGPEVGMSLMCLGKKNMLWLKINGKGEHDAG